MLSLPSALAGLVLGVVLAELLVPAITLTSSATAPVPPVLIEFGWAQTLPLALAVAVLPVLAAALTIARAPGRRRRTPRVGVSMRPALRLNRTVGAAAGSMLALALLVCGCVFAALAGPALSQHTRTPGAAPDPGQASAPPPRPSRSARTGAISPSRCVQNGVGNSQNLTPAELAGPPARSAAASRRSGSRSRPASAAEPGHQRARRRLGCRAADADWRAAEARGALPRPADQQRPAHGGRYAEAAVPAGMVAVAATTQTAARFGLHPGSRLSVATPSGHGRAVRHRDRAATRPWLDLLGAGPDRGHPRAAAARPRARRSGWAASSPTRTSSPRCRTRSTGRAWS